MLGFKSVFLHQHPPAFLLSFLLVPAPQTLPISQTSVFGKHFPKALAFAVEHLIASLQPGFVKGLIAKAKTVLIMLSAEEAEERNKLQEIGGKASLLRFTEQVVCLFYLRSMEARIIAYCSFLLPQGEITTFRFVRKCQEHLLTLKKSPKPLLKTQDIVVALCSVYILRLEGSGLNTLRTSKSSHNTLLRSA